MPFLRHIAWAALAGIMLAGCGGGGIASTVPSGPSAAATAREPQRIAPAVTGTLYVADHFGVSAFDMNATGAATALRSFNPHKKQANNELIQGIATAADGTLAVVQNLFINNVSNCRTTIYPQNAGPAVPPLGTYPCDPTTPADTQAETIARGANGFDLVYRSGGASGVRYIERLGENGAIASTMALLPGLYFAIASTPGGGDFVGGSGGVYRYGAGATDANLFTAHFTPPGGSVHAVAESPDHTLYVAAGPFGSESIYAYAKGATTASRVIGPFTSNYITAMTVDAQNLLYVALPTTNNGQNNQVSVYAADAAGNATPLRTLTNPRPYLEIFGLAIAQP